MKKTAATVLAILLSTLLFTACAKEEGKVTETAPSKIDEFNKRNADAIVNKIRTPIDKARLTKGLGDKRLEEMDKALQNQ